MEMIIRSIKSSIDTENWYAALFQTLVLPDICGKLETPKVKGKPRYIRWFKKYVEAKYIGLGPDRTKDFVRLSGSDCYALRCSLLHEGRSFTKHQSAQSVIEYFEFTEGSPRVSGHNNYYHRENGSTYLQLQVDLFCKDFIAGVKCWEEEFANDADIARRVDQLILVRTEPSFHL